MLKGNTVKIHPENGIDPQRRAMVMRRDWRRTLPFVVRIRSNPVPSAILQRSNGNGTGLIMSKIIRERYEAGTLVSREIEGSNVNGMEIAKLLTHLVIAVSVAVIAVLSAMDTLGYSGLYDETGGSDASCRSTRIQS